MNNSSDSFLVPIDYDELLSFYTHRGFRVIACATKRIEKLNWAKIHRMKRSEAESDLEFLGFIVFENKLKSSTTCVIDELSQAGIRNIMCTGDNILTAISVARECHLIDKTAHCFVPHFTEGLLSQSSLLNPNIDGTKEIMQIRKPVYVGRVQIIQYLNLMIRRF